MIDALELIGQYLPLLLLRGSAVFVVALVVAYWLRRRAPAVRLVLDNTMNRKTLSKSQAWLTVGAVAILSLPMALVGFGDDSDKTEKGNGSDTGILTATEESSEEDRDSEADGLADLDAGEAGLIRHKLETMVPE